MCSHLLEADHYGLAIDKNQSREIIYGMPHEVWKDKYQKDASAEQLDKFVNRNN